MFKRIRPYFLTLTALFFLSGCTTSHTPISPEPEQKTRVLLGETTTSLFIAHAGGTVLSDEENGTGTNSLEAIIDSYASGFRFIEIDFSLTKDGYLVLFHDGAEKYIDLPQLIDETTKKEFLTKKFQEKYTLLSLSDLLSFMKEKPDLYIVTDFKSDFSASLNALLQEPLIQEIPSLKNKFIIQMYHPDQIDILQKNMFDHVIFTLYRTQMNDDAVIEFIEQHPTVEAVTMWWDKRYTDQFAQKIMQKGRGVYVHTINDIPTINTFIDKSVGVYTDYVDVWERVQ